MSRFFSLLVIASELALPGAAATLPDRLLDLAGKRVERFWTEFTSVSCTETVMQRKLSPQGNKSIAERRSAFDYLILLNWTGDELNVEESRLLKGKEAKETGQHLLTTSGFSTLLLILHPNIQPHYEFTLLDDDQFGGKILRRVGFEHRPRARSLSVLQLRGRDYPIEWKGVIWIDPASGAISRVEAELSKPMEDVGLVYMKANVQYEQTRFKGKPEVWWLPRIATIDVRTMRQYWRNVHEFADYRQFTVATDEKVGAPKQ